MERSEYLKIGKIARAHGIHGDVRVLAETDFPETRFAPGKEVFLDHSMNVKPMKLTIQKCRPHKNIFIIKFEEWDNINTVEDYRGGNLFVLREDAMDVKEDKESFYYHEIIGCKIETLDGENKGVIENILRYPANDVWVCRNNGKEWLLPYIKDVVKEVDLANRKILIQWMEGMD